MIKNNDDMFCIYNLKEDKNVETNSVLALFQKKKKLIVSGINSSWIIYTFTLICQILYVFFSRQTNPFGVKYLK